MTASTPIRMTITWHCRECDATGTTDAGAARHTLTTTHGTVTVTTTEEHQ